VETINNAAREHHVSAVSSVWGLKGAATLEGIEDVLAEEKVVGMNL
jgi:hypothetical protein